MVIHLADPVADSSKSFFISATQIQKSDSLRELVVANVDMPQSCLVALVTVLSENNTMTALNVSNCRLFSREVRIGKSR